MLNWIAGGAVLAAMAVVLHWWRRRYDSRTAPPRVPWVSVGLLLAIAVVAGGFALRHQLLERRLSRVASELAGRKVAVRCESYTATFVDPFVEPGYVPFEDGRPARVTTVKPDVCRQLASYLRSSKRDPTPEQVFAVHLLSHESMHLRGILDEAQAECAAVQRDARTARLLGAPADAAAALARTYWQADYPRMPSDYRSGGCGPGQPLDEHLPDAPWPQG